MSDTRKTIRSFQCRDALWERFEEMAGELECSVDYLINDSMKQYARQRGYGATRGAAGPPPPSRSSLQPPPAATSSAPTGPPAAAGSPAPPLPPASPKARSRVAPPPPGAGHSPPAPPPPRHKSSAGSGSRVAPPPVPRAVPPPPPPTAPAARQQPVLSAYYEGQQYPVNKDRFIIGRGKQSTDLTIKDPNVSRQHCMVEMLNGQYYMVDMGSTNGVEFGGKRVQRQPVNDGDVFRVCDHELSFSFS